MAEEFAGIKGFDTNTQLNAGDLEFNESSVENEEVIKLGTGALMTILMGVFFIVAVTFSSIILWLNTKKAL
jgi:hypothetical protein